MVGKAPRVQVQPEVYSPLSKTIILSQSHLPAARIPHFFNTRTGKKAPSCRGYHWGLDSRPLYIRPSMIFTATIIPPRQNFSSLSFNLRTLHERSSLLSDSVSQTQQLWTISCMPWHACLCLAHILCHSLRAYQWLAESMGVFVWQDAQHCSTGPRNTIRRVRYRRPYVSDREIFFLIFFPG